MKGNVDFACLACKRAANYQACTCKTSKILLVHYEVCLNHVGSVRLITQSQHPKHMVHYSASIHALLHWAGGNNF